MDSKKFYTFGWQGINIWIPEDWNLSFHTGNFERGYLRINDLNSVRCEIKWEKTEKILPLPLILNNYLKKMKKIAFKKKFDFEFKENLENLKISAQNITYITFWWKSQEECFGIIWYCYICKRIFILQLLSPEKDLPYKKIISSITCEMEENFNFWNVYNLSLRLPKQYFLKENSFKSGFIYLKFSNNKHNISLFRYALANIALKEKTLSEWFTENFLHIFRIYKTKEEEISLNGHSGIKIEGERDSILRNISGKLLSRFGVDEKFLKVFVWSCENSNRIYVLKISGNSKENLEEILKFWKCHPQEI